MLGEKSFACAFLVLFTMNSFVEAQKKVVCYWYPSNSGGGMSIAAIDINICTHIIFSFLEIDANGGIVYQSRTPSFVSSQLSQLRARSSSLKIIVAFGGANDNVLGAFSSISRNSNARNNFANNVYNFLSANRANGVDIDWEYPDSVDKANFVALLNTLKQRMGSKFSVSCAIGAGSWRTGISYDVRGIFANTDFVNVMTYDMHGSWEGKTGLHSALFRGPSDQTALNVHESISHLVQNGADRNKIIVGIPAYAKGFFLKDNNNNGIGAPTTLNAPEAITYRDMCQRIKQNSMTYRWEEAQKTPYAFTGNLWFGFDGVRSVDLKARYIIDNGLGGAMFWALDNDDYDGVCGSGRFPLIGTVSRIIRGRSAPDPSPTTPDTTTQTSNGEGEALRCPDDDFIQKSFRLFKILPMC